MAHESHAGIIKRLKVANGHLKKTIEMIEDERSCVELAQQLAAVESAIRSAKIRLIHDHVDHCLSDSIKNQGNESELVNEFKQITKFL
ncbi:MAG: metal-sensing transcriptional repressor [Pseudomonadota bacterium]